MYEQTELTKQELLELISGEVSLFLVCGNSFLEMPFFQEVRDTSVKLTIFTEFSSNPDLGAVKRGITDFQKSHADFILAVGGGSSIDIAKSIKAYANAGQMEDLLGQEIVENKISLVAVPTTAGSGSEATHFAVVYHQGVKYSVAHASLLPGYTVLLPELLCTLPRYQRESTLLDVFAHAIESIWSVRATEESKKYAKEAIKAAIHFYPGYLNNQTEGNKGMLLASHKAGQAINISQTTAAHAMSYKLTSLSGISHGHAVALCLSKLFPFMWIHRNQCADQGVFSEIAEAMGKKNPEEGIEKFSEILSELTLTNLKQSELKLEELVASVNKQRLQNNPMVLSESDIRSLYQEIINSQ